MNSLDNWTITWRLRPISSIGFDLTEKQVDILFPSAARDAMMNDSSGYIGGQGDSSSDDDNENSSGSWNSYMKKKSQRFRREDYDTYRELYEVITALKARYPIEGVNLQIAIDNWNRGYAADEIKMKPGHLAIGYLYKIVRKFHKKTRPVLTKSQKRRYRRKRIQALKREEEIYFSYGIR